jgi:hypothetical protein
MTRARVAGKHERRGAGSEERLVLDPHRGHMDLMGGGIDNGSDVRLRRQLTLLADLDLDVAALQECKRGADDDSALLHLAEEQFGMTGFLAESAQAWRGYPAALARPGIQASTGACGMAATRCGRLRRQH